MFAPGFAEVGLKSTKLPAAYTSPIAERIPPPFLIEIFTAGSTLLAAHKFASDDTLPKLDSSVLTAFLLPSRNTVDLPYLLPSLLLMTFPIAEVNILTKAPLVPAVKAVA